MKKLIASGLVILLAPAANAILVVEDDFTDGIDTSWYTASSSSAIEMNSDSLGLVSGGSGRGIHTTFADQTLANIGDELVVSYSFNTPATVNNSDGLGSGSSGAFRVGVFDDLGRNLSQNISASSGSPNALYGWSVGNGGPGDAGLPGYMMDHDVNTGSGADINFRDHNTGSATGRLMATTGSGSFSSFSSGPDAGYSFGVSSSYSGSITLKRTGATDLELTGVFDGNSYTLTDNAADSFTFASLFFHANSNQFGSSSSAGDPDNGLDFTSYSVNFNPIPEPSSIALLGLGALCMARRRR
ncbi:PEP-CTERM sorting domain-containing protein [Haloferula sp.]|uniref:PEP-CTERM sorting domain-containing protein n=1 Tax=Haloferula sp. TaxID=2497595 RepID=UPI0032A0B519